jgi:hypothetical protein
VFRLRSILLSDGVQPVAYLKPSPSLLNQLLLEPPYCAKLRFLGSPEESKTTVRTAVRTLRKFLVDVKVLNAEKGIIMLSSERDSSHGDTWRASTPEPEIADLLNKIKKELDRMLGPQLIGENIENISAIADALGFKVSTFDCPDKTYKISSDGETVEFHSTDPEKMAGEFKWADEASPPAEVARLANGVKELAGMTGKRVDAVLLYYEKGNRITGAKVHVYDVALK